MMAAFARPDLGWDEWFAAVEPFLTLETAMVYADTDPANIPVRRVTGPAVVVDESSVYLAGVTVPTDVGVFTVLLVREAAGDPWLVSRLTFPEGVG
jgi:hypothetical protein